MMSDILLKCAHFINRYVKLLEVNSSIVTTEMKF